jgi:hypothetical protein
MQSFSYADFVSTVKQDGLAKQNRFYVSISMPSKRYGESQNMGSESIRKLHLLCKSVSLPGVSLQTATTRITGEAYELPVTKMYTGCTMIFYMDRHFIVRQFFEDWMGSIQDPKTREISYYNDYTVKIEIFVMNRDESAGPDYKITLHEAYPKTVGQLMLDQENSQIMLLDIGFDYHNYTSETIASTPSATPAGNPDEYTYVNNLPQSGIGILSGGPKDSRSQIQLTNPLKAAYSDYTQAIQDYNNNFQDFQSFVSNGFDKITGTGIPIESILSGDVRNISNRAKEFARGEAREIARQGVGAVFGGKLKIGKL